MPWNKIALIGANETIHLTLLELPFNPGAAINGVWWWNQDRYTALGTSETRDYVWIHTGTHVSIGTWNGTPRDLTWIIYLYYVRRASNGKFAVMYSKDSEDKSKG